MVFYKPPKSMLIIATVCILVSIALVSAKRSALTAKTSADSAITIRKGVQVFKSEDEFYKLYDEAVADVNSGKYDEAVVILNQALSHVEIGLEKGMVYKRLAEIYRIQNNLRKELFYSEEFQKYSMNKDLNDQFAQRVAEIKQELAIDRTPSPRET